MPSTQGCERPGADREGTGESRDRVGQIGEGAAVEGPALHVDDAALIVAADQHYRVNTRG
jgi:hypothetical protein